MKIKKLIQREDENAGNEMDICQLEKKIQDWKMRNVYVTYNVFKYIENLAFE